MANRKYHTFLIMPSTPGKRIVKFSLPSFCWRFLYLVATAILVWAGIGTWSVYHHYEIFQRSQRLERENRLAKSRLEFEKQKVENLNHQLHVIRQKSVFIQNFLGLKPQGGAVGKIGQGGVEVSPQAFPQPSDSSSDDRPLVSNTSEFSESPFLTPQNIVQLDKDLFRVITTLKDRQRQMEHTPSISPVDPQKSWISSAFGMRISPFTGKRQFHPGLDIAGWKGTPIVAPAKGKVISVRKWGSMGLMVSIRHDATYKTVYGHLLKAAVKRGQHVNRGEIIGYMGNSGRSTGYHLHYEVHKDGKRKNPFAYMMDWDKNSVLMAAAVDN
jgi:murein DD-endopeptidase MepM/ murein hydrolase activator NlpD